MRDLSRLLLWPLGDSVRRENSANALFADPGFRLWMIAATFALAVFAVTVFLRVVKWQPSVMRKLGFVSLLSAATALLSIVAGILTSRL